MAFVGLFDDFRLGIANPWTSPALHVASDDGGRPDLQGFLYSIVGPFNYFSTRNVELTMTATPLAAAVPEPATWLTMLAGFGLVGAGLRGRRRAAIPA
ncbi:PEPxxWA-CTERM sorting domain-containing protein [Sphingomonas sp. XMGL2]|uniref:PEPxxWA-CTERM sorting domain-containing protein n=2 Tax=Sphingomonas quercus TaxID=2842451 RepID=A0ABS6BFP3_9SPHN|nr:PEPxxWA-CTERM sorting domain-containing protein [Sphingomonas quercus]